MRYIDIKRLLFFWSFDDSYILLQVKNFDYEGDSSNSGAPYPVPAHLTGSKDGSTIGESIIKTIDYAAAPGLPNIASTTGNLDIFFLFPIHKTYQYNLHWSEFC